MADIFTIKQKSGVAMRSLRKLDKLGYLHVDKNKDKVAETINATLSNRNRLNTLQLLHLYRNPKIAEKLDLEYDVDKLGNVEDEAAPWVPVGVRIATAAGRSPEAIETVAEYCKSVLDRLPAGVEVEHAYLGVRLLYNAAPEFLDEVSTKLRGAMWKVRASDILAGYSKLTEKGSARYFRKIMLDI